MQSEWMRKTKGLEKKLCKILKKMQKVQVILITLSQKKEIKMCKEESKVQQGDSELIIITICRDQDTHILIHNLHITLIQVRRLIFILLLNSIL